MAYIFCGLIFYSETVSIFIGESLESSDANPELHYILKSFILKLIFRVFSTLVKKSVLFLTWENNVINKI